jgi:phosphate transport system protein
MQHRLTEELDLLKQQLLDMAARVELNIGNALDGLRDRDSDALRQVILKDDEIDLAELRVDSHCLSLLALRQPVAGDLRFIVTALKIVKDIERIGDIAKSIAKHGLGILQERPLSVSGELGRMASTARGMLKNGLDAFVREDVELAQKVIKDDDSVDSLHRENVRQFIDMMMGDRSIIGPMTQLLSVNKLLERIGDHSSNIAAMVVFMVEGRDVRHPKKQGLLRSSAADSE